METKSVVCKSCGAELKINYRWAERKDVSAVLRLLGGLPKTGVKEYIKNFLVAESNGVLIACMGYEIHKKEFAVLRSLKVQKAFRRTGIATILFTQILEQLRVGKISSGIGFTLTSKMEAMVKKFEAIKISHKYAFSHIDRSQPSELFDDNLSDKCQAWLFPIKK